MYLKIPQSSTQLTLSSNLLSENQTKSLKLEFLIDTGFEGDLAIHHSFAKKLDLIVSSIIQVELADGSIIPEPVCGGLFQFMDSAFEVEILLTNDSEDSLIGYQLLEKICSYFRCRFVIDFE